MTEVNEKYYYVVLGKVDDLEWAACQNFVKKYHDIFKEIKAEMLNSLL